MNILAIYLMGVGVIFLIICRMVSDDVGKMIALNKGKKKVIRDHLMGLYFVILVISIFWFITMPAFIVWIAQGLIRDGIEKLKLKFQQA